MKENLNDLAFKLSQDFATRMYDLKSKLQLTGITEDVLVVSDTDPERTFWGYNTGIVLRFSEDDPLYIYEVAHNKTYWGGPKIHSVFFDPVHVLEVLTDGSVADYVAGLKRDSNGVYFTEMDPAIEYEGSWLSILTKSGAVKSELSKPDFCPFVRLLYHYFQDELDPNYYPDCGCGREGRKSERTMRKLAEKIESMFDPKSKEFGSRSRIRVKLVR
ncbi:hypothetical protein HZC30_03400 [Candidatus Woesearchaeota archaeon]|nr:hypothetical protein [Candidatus Woesearchaeota archaeon]